MGVYIKPAKAAISIASQTPNPSRPWQAVTVSGTVTAINPYNTFAPQGETRVFGAGGASCTAAIGVGGAWSCSMTVAVEGTADIVAEYHSVPWFGSLFALFGEAATAPHTVNRVPTTTVISSDAPDSSRSGEPVTVSGTVSATVTGGGTVSGTVTVGGAGGAGCTATVANGAWTCAVAVATTGAGTLSATYGGSTNYGASSSSTAHTVIASDTTTTVASDGSDPSVVGESYTVEVTVASVSPGARTPQGTVVVSDGTGNTCTVTLAAGTGSCALPSTDPGAKTITASYSGSASHNGSTTTEPHTVNRSATATTVTVTKGTVEDTIDVTVAPIAPGSGTPTGTVALSDTTGVRCNLTLVAGSGSCTVPTSTPGSTTMTAAYGGDTGYQPSTGSGVNRALSTTVVSTAAPSSRTGEPYEVTVTVSPQTGVTGTPTGTAAVSDGQGETCTATLTGGTGSCSLASIGGDIRTLVAEYPGDAVFKPSSGSLVHYLDRAATTTTVFLTYRGGGYDFYEAHVAAVVPALGLPVGDVYFRTDTGSTCFTALRSDWNLWDGSFASASCSVPSSALGTATMTAAYFADHRGGDFDDSFGDTVNLYTTSVDVSPPLVAPVTGEPYTVGVDVQARYGWPSAPTGTVTVGDGAGGLCTVTLSGSSGSCSLTSLRAGTTTLTGTYGGDMSYLGSSGTGTLAVQKGDTTTVITGDGADPSVVGESYTVGVNVVAVAPGAGTPTGSVVIDTGNGVTCAATLLNGTGACTLTGTTPTTHVLSATYSGDTDFNASAGTAPHTVVKANTVTTITSDGSDPSTVGGSYTVAVRVDPVAPGAGTPTGTVTIVDGTGGSCLAVLAAGSGSCSLTSSRTGVKMLQATYGGDSSFNTSVTTEDHTVVEAPPVVVPGVVTATVRAGATVSTDTGGTGATSDAPIQLAVTTPAGGTVAIEIGVTAPATTYTILGAAISVTAPSADPSDPLILVFSFDETVPGVSASADLYRNGVLVPECAAVAPAPAVAEPDPCVWDRTLTPSGDVEITAATSAASLWWIADPQPTATTSAAEEAPAAQTAPPPAETTAAPPPAVPAPSSADLTRNTGTSILTLILLIGIMLAAGTTALAVRSALRRV